MSQVENQIRETIVAEVAGKIGVVDPGIKQVIHHSSTRRPDGSREDSDIDLCLVVETFSLAYTALYRESLGAKIAAVVDKHGLQIGNESLQLHLTIMTDEAIADPERFIETDQGRQVLQEILTKGKVVYSRD